MNESYYLNKIKTILLTSLFDSVSTTASFFKLEVSVHAYSINGFRANVQIQKGSSGQQYRLLSGSYLSEQVYTNNYANIINRNERDVRVISVITNTNNFPNPTRVMLVIKISVVESIGHSNRIIGFTNVRTKVTKPAITRSG